MVGLVDIVPEHAEAYADAYGGPTYPDVTSLMSEARPDLVSVATPPGAHAEVAAKVLRAGGSVLIEKPPCPTLAEFDVVAEAERAGGGTAYVVFQHRHGSGARRAAELLGSGALGRPLVAVCETLWFRPDSYFDPDWRGTWSGEGGGPTLGHGIHQIDLLLHLLGPWHHLTATAVRLARPVEFEDVSLATVGFEDGAVASVVNSLLSPRELSRIRIDTTAGTLEVNHVYGYRDADWSFFPLPQCGGGGEPRPGSRESATTTGARDSGRRRQTIRPMSGRPAPAPTCRATTPLRSPGWSTTCSPDALIRPPWPAPAARSSSSPRCTPPRCSAPRSGGPTWCRATRSTPI